MTWDLKKNSGVLKLTTSLSSANGQPIYTTARATVSFAANEAPALALCGSFENLAWWLADKESTALGSCEPQKLFVINPPWKPTAEL